jgi:hypothetical protein
LHRRIYFKFEDSIDIELLTGLVFNSGWPAFGIKTSTIYDQSVSGPSFHVQNLRLVSRTGPTGNQINYIVFTLIQRAGISINDEKITGVYIPDTPMPPGGLEVRGGCTMIFDLDTLSLRYAIAKPILSADKLKQGIRVLNEERFVKQHRYQTEEGLLQLSEQSLYFGMGMQNSFNEPFAFLHAH